MFSCSEQFLVGRVAKKHQRLVQLVRDQFGALPLHFDQLDLVALFERPGNTQANVAAPGHHDALDRLHHPPQLGQNRPDVLGGGEDEHLVTGLDDRVPFRDDRLVAPEDGGDAGVGFGRQVQPHVLDRLADQHAALEGAHRHHGDPAVGEAEDLQRLGKLDQAADVVGDDLLRTERVIDREIVRREQAGIFQEVPRAQPGDPRRHVEHGVRQLAGDQVGLVALRHGDQHVGVLGAGIAHHRRRRRIAEHRAQVKAIL